jgi:hypothetical protein
MHVAYRRPDREPELPPLENGDHLDQPTFHQRYEAMPEHVRAELIGGIVFMASPMKRPHGRQHVTMSFWLELYSAHTPGTEPLDNTTAILGDDSEPQPDSALLILPECGGQTRDDGDDYIRGAPEWLGEIAASSKSIDLNLKLRDYEQAGVREYVVCVLSEKRVVWFIRRGDRFEELPPGPDGICRSEVFPGLWLDADALLRRNTLRVEEVLRQGLATPEHQAFVESLRRP